MAIRGENKEDRFGFRLKPSFASEFRDFAKATGADMTDLIERGLKIVMTESDAALSGTDSFRAPFLTKAPCGPFREALDYASHYTLSRDVADTLEARDGDCIVQADGESNLGVGINDGDFMLMRPLPEGRAPARGEVALVQIFRADGECEGTVKTWMSSEPVRLADGDGNELELPDDVERVVAVAVLRGMIARR